MVYFAAAVNLGALQLRALFEHWPSAKPMLMGPETSSKQPQREQEKRREEEMERDEGEEEGSNTTTTARENGGRICVVSIL